MLTLRDETDDALFCRIQRVLPKIEQRMEIQRQQRQERQQANNGNGNHTTDAAPPDTDDDPYCDFHDVPLKRYSRDGQTWYSHYDADSGKWCRGK